MRWSGFRFDHVRATNQSRYRSRLIKHDARRAGPPNDRKNRLMAEASMKGALNGNRVIVTIASVADQIHDAAMKETSPVLLKAA
jgi:hypothetical protein